MNDFPFEKTDQIRKPWTEAALVERLRDGLLTLPPATVQVLTTQAPPLKGPRCDGSLQAEWQGKKAQYVFEYKTNSFPKVLDTAIWQVRAAAEEIGLLPLVIVPYLSADALSDLEARQ